MNGANDMEIMINATGVRARLEFTASELTDMREALAGVVSDYEGVRGHEGPVERARALSQRLTRDLDALNEFQLTGTIGGATGFTS
jgi:hypothetical protein